MTMRVEPFSLQEPRWPRSGRHILAQYDEENIVVYQAYRPSIGRYAVEHQEFGGDFSFSRMSWIKPNFLWMMYRSGWGTKEGQEVTLAVTISRAFFDEILSLAVPSSYTGAIYLDQADWKRAVADSDVRLQWDPDHSPSGAKEGRKAIQLGLRGDLLRRYGQQEVISIEDISEFVAEQRPNAESVLATLETPREAVYFPEKEAVRQRVGLETAKPEPALADARRKPNDRA